MPGPHGFGDWILEINGTRRKRGGDIVATRQVVITGHWGIACPTAMDCGRDAEAIIDAVWNTIQQHPEPWPIPERPTRRDGQETGRAPLPAYQLEFAL